MRWLIRTSILLFLLVGGSLFGQRDSLVLVHAAWSRDTLGGMVLHTVQFEQQEYFASNQYIAVLEIPATPGLEFRLGYAPKRTRTSAIAKAHDAVAAVNGSFFDMDRHNPICHLRIDGEEYGINTPGKDTVNRKYYQYGTLVLRHGRPVILRTDSARLWERMLPDSNIMTAGPLLIYGDTLQPMRNDLSFVNKRHNRTAVGVKPDGTVLLLVVDGRTKQSEGMTLDELSSTLHWLGCCDALNLDGGGSTTLYLRDYPHGGIVNHPSDNGRFDHDGERTVSNILFVVDTRVGRVR
ncbi:MAG: phosphodiester glycosidase family protein [Bacteroidales bacterium]|nr:phosphodiester glycosidase family protein [Bacteroidales bacterium]